MTPIVTPRHKRGASLALGGMFVVASTMLAGAPTAGAAPSADAVKAIDDHYPSVASVLGQATGEATDVATGVEKAYTEGAIYYTKETGAKAMYGEIFKKYQAVGGPAELGFPTNDESDTGDGMGRFNEFAGKDGETNAIFWGPNTGAWVMRGKVYDAWKASGGIKGPFGYPKDDTMMMGDTWTSNFAGPEGTQISWSKAAGLVTIPAALAGKINLGGASSAVSSVASSVSKSVTAGTTKVEEKKGGFKWWWLLPLLLLALIPFLLKLFRKPEPEPVRVATKAPEVKKVVTPPPPPVKKVVAPPPPPPVKKVAPPPPAPKPVVKTPPPPAPRPVTPPPAPRPVVPEAPKLVERVEHKVEHVAEKVEHKVEHVAEKVERFVEHPRAAIHEAHIEHETSPVIRYESTTPVNTGIEVVYENNAVDGRESRADKSDLTPDHLQE